MRTFKFLKINIVFRGQGGIFLFIILQIDEFSKRQKQSFWKNQQN
jgi:hypothetical protein